MKYRSRMRRESMLWWLSLGGQSAGNDSTTNSIHKQSNSIEEFKDWLIVIWKRGAVSLGIERGRTCIIDSSENENHTTSITTDDRHAKAIHSSIHPFIHSSIHPLIAYRRHKDCASTSVLYQMICQQIATAIRCKWRYIGINNWSINQTGVLYEWENGRHE